MKRLTACWLAGWFTVAGCCAFAQEDAALSKARFIDKCKGAWAGQMIGVCYGAPYEFRFNGKPVPGDLQPWKPERIQGAIGQDDLYVEMTFLKALEQHGLDISFEQAGQAFGDTKYDLWHANRAGRDNIRRGIMPPQSGQPEFNRHADDIDFQIEADLFGILCPGLAQESNRLCDVFGHIMNYGDGVYGGMFVAGMYAAGYFEDEDVAKVVDAGLACIPAESLYHQCISDVIAWHREAPGDWLATWNKIEEKWQDDIDCAPGNPFNIDAKINGAYIAMGLLYGNGGMQKTIEIGTRCGQDADCNPSNAAGVLGCMKGFEALGAEWTGGIPAMENTVFAYTDYSFKTLIPACQRLTEAIIIRTGGQVTAEGYTIRRQPPKAAAPLEQWTNQMDILSVPILPHEMKAWDAAWRVTACGPDMEPGVRDKCFGKENILLIHPVDRDHPAVIEASLDVPATGSPKLAIPVASDTRGDFLLKVFVKGELAQEIVVDTQGKWTEVDVDLAKHKGTQVPVRIENHADDWAFEAAYLGHIAVN